MDQREVASNTPYDQFARKVLTASGSNRENPPASYFKIVRDPLATMENTTHLFMAIRFNCNKCHDHPFERWTQDQYYQTAAFFSQVKLNADPASKGQQIGGTDVEPGKPLYEIVDDTNQAEVKHERTGQLTPPKFPFEVPFQAPENAAAPREAGVLGHGQGEPLLRPQLRQPGLGLPVRGRHHGADRRHPRGNPPTNPELLDYLTQEFVSHGFDVRHMMREICKSRTYQLSVETNKWNADDKQNYSHATARRLPAEVLYDSVYRVTGSVSKIPGVPPGTRAAEVPDTGVELPSGFFATFGRPVRESACECERSSGLQLGPVMALISGPAVGDAIADPNSELTKLVAREPDDRKLIDELFVRILNRPATPKEMDEGVQELQGLGGGAQEARRRLRTAREGGRRAKAQARKGARGLHRRGQAGAGRVRERPCPEARRAGKGQGREDRGP